MAEETAISWTNKTWSPWYGCTQVSLGPQGACVGCYARQLSEFRFHRVVFGGPGRGEGTRDVRADSAWKEPLRWECEAAAAKRAWFAPEGPPHGGMGAPWPHSPTVFPSMCDPFDNHPDLVEPRRRFFDLIRATPHLTWLLLTKRPGNIVKLSTDTVEPSLREAWGVWDRPPETFWPRNAAIGCTVVNQEEANRDIPKLLAAKASLKPAFAFVSMEPLLGPVDLTRIRRFPAGASREYINALAARFWTDQTGLPNPDPTWAYPGRPFQDGTTAIDWVITGGETDQGPHKARPSHPDWFRSLRDQCADAGVPFHHKQNGEWAPNDTGHAITGGSVPGDHSTFECATFADGQRVNRVGKKAAGRLLDGVLHDAMPAVA